MAQILIIEDETLLAKSLSRALIADGHDCAVASSAEHGIELLQQMPSDLVILDVQLPGMTGLEAIRSIKELDSNIAVIIATAYGTMAAAVEALRFGASDFLRKPLDTEEVLLAVDRALGDARLRHTVSYYRDLEAGKADEDAIIAESEAMRKVVNVLDRLARVNLHAASDYPPILVTGETGTGKDLIVRKIHFSSPLADAPFVEVNCTTLPRGLEEAELFGYEKGAFTGADRSKRGLFEAADGGTLFLNEIGDLSIEVQVKLLQSIEGHTIRRVGGLRDIPIDVRICAATNRELKGSRNFREDLYYRLHNTHVEMPPLRNRREDILPLAANFLKRFGRKYGRSKRLSDDANGVLTRYDWPGNVRELRQLIERITFLTEEPVVTAAQIGLPVPGAPAVKIHSSQRVEVSFPNEGLDLDEIERKLLQAALEASGQNVSEAARKLNLGREAMRYRLKKHGLE